ncbi:DNRLRE domain-containing protein [Gracilibacillus caseinilyticus]|uniref:DNRLRE domain-containing protein n=1 Tax=Gracilibacillus caseinilyticus TaxID=2932256 RepID=A0ABY4EVH4_9BACI|nr:DNRLRE domain-containing protein [Gracilibacillus caseinilyticus]UOQ47654.1 DNRLRE domain-containing protein [Gracilibacillus caseinilyticus]
MLGKMKLENVRSLALMILLIAFSLFFMVLQAHTVHASSAITIDSHVEGQSVPVGVERISGTYTKTYNMEIVINGKKIVKVQTDDPNGDDTGIWYYDLDTSNYDGEIELMVKGQDTVSRSNAWSILHVNVDNAAANVPTVSIDYPADGSSVKGNVNIKIAVEAKNNIKRVEVRMNGGAWKEASLNNKHYKYKWDTSGIGDKTSSIETRAIDSRGNVGKSSTTYVKVGEGTNETTSAVDQDRSMWIWEKASYNLLLNPGSRKVLDAMAKDTTTFDQDPITTLYFGVDTFNGMDMLEDEREKVRDFVSWAHDSGYKIHALIAGGTNPPYFGAYTRYHDLAIKEFEKVLNYNISSSSNERFDGVNVDTEPYILPDFKSAYPSVQIQYLDYFEKLMQRRDTAGYNLLVGAAIPRWYDSSSSAENIDWNGDTKWMSQHIQDIADYISIMDYWDVADDSPGIIPDAQSEIDYANLIGKPNSVIIGVETKDIANSGDPETISFREEGRTYMEAELDKVYQAFNGEEAFGGIALHHYDEIRALPSAWGPNGYFWEPPADSTAPSAISENPAATGFDFQSIGIEYGRAFDNTEVESYNIYRSTSSDFTPDDSNLAGTARGLSYTDNGLLPNTKYYYKVAAVDVQGNIGPISDEASAVTDDTTLKPMIIDSMDVSYNESKGNVTLQVVDKDTLEGIQAEVHGRFTHMAGKYISVTTDEKGTAFAMSESVVENWGEIGFEPRRIVADGYYWAQAYDHPHQTSTTWSQEIYTVAEDAHVRGGSYADMNFGADTAIQIKDVSGSNYYDRLGFFKFDLSSFSGNAITSAVLYFYTSASVTNLPVTIAGLSTDSWMENSITWNNQPVLNDSAIIGSIDVSNAGWYSMDVTNFINSQMEDKVASFRLSDQAAKDSLIMIDSKENKNPAYLVIQ